MRCIAGLACVALALLPGAVTQICRAGQSSVTAECTAPNIAFDTAIPFSQAAVWAADRIPQDCDREAHKCHWRKASNAWRYVLNNLRLAIHGAGAEDKTWLPLDQVKELQSIVSQMGHDPAVWSSNWPGQMAAYARTVVDQLGASGWADNAAPVMKQMPRADIGTWFPTQRRSVTVSVNGDIGTTVTLANGFPLPLLGFGVWQIPADGTTYQAVTWALDVGYRHIDTAQAYGNEREVGAALANSPVPRSEVCLVTKLSNPQEFPVARQRFEEQLKLLQVEYVDVYMLHSPGDSLESRKQAWQQIEQLYDEGKIKALGVSNFDMALLKELLSFARVRPVYIQNKYSIYQPGSSSEAEQTESLMEWLAKEKITMTGYSIIHPGHGSYLAPLEDPHVLAIAKRHGKTASQVLHRWLLQLGAVVIPRSTKLDRIRENADLFSFALTEPDMRLLNGISTLMSSDEGKHRPEWCDDVYGLQLQNS